MAFETKAMNYTAEEVAGLAGPDGVFQHLYDLLWEDYSDRITDGRAYVIWIRRHPPAPVLGQPEGEPERWTYAVRLSYVLASALTAKVGETVHDTCIPGAAVTDEGPPKLAEMGVRRFRRTDEGWIRVPD